MPTEKLKGTTDQWTIKRTYEPALLEMDGRQVPRGFGVVQGTVEEFRNPMTQLGVGQRGFVTLDVARKNTWLDVPAGAVGVSGGDRADSRPARRSSRTRFAADSSGSSFRPARSRSTWAIAARWGRSVTKSTATRRASTARFRRSFATPTGRSNWRPRSRNRWSCCRAGRKTTIRIG